MLVKNSSDRPGKWDKGVIEKCFGPVTYQVKVLGVSKQVHADHIVRQPDKLSMPTPVKEGNPTIKSDNAKTLVHAVKKKLIVKKGYCNHADFSSVPHSLICKKFRNSLIRREECTIMIMCTMLCGECALISNRHVQSSSCWDVQYITIVIK